MTVLERLASRWQAAFDAAARALAADATLFSQSELKERKQALACDRREVTVALSRLAAALGAERSPSVSSRIGVPRVAGFQDAVARGHSKHTKTTEDEMNPVMLATDGSPSAEEATRQAIDLAHALHAPLTVVSVAHAAAPFTGYYGYATTDLIAELSEIQRTHVEQVLATVRDRAAAAGVSGQTIPLEGMPGEEICKAAREHDVRLVVIGAHGWGRMGRIVHGSVSDYVLHHAGVPVLVVAGDAVADTERAEAAA